MKKPNLIFILVGTALSLATSCAAAAPTYQAGLPCTEQENTIQTHASDTYNDVLACIGGVWHSMVFGGSPSGSIVAFTTDACPTGWVDVPALAGRTIINDGQGAGLTFRNLGNYGGEETHQQTISEMPAHSHSYAGGSTSFNQVYQMSTGSVVDHYALATGSDTNSGNISETGGNQPFNVMQPWYALHYCMKQ